jgi:hypothetical protein
MKKLIACIVAGIKEEAIMCDRTMDEDDALAM